MEDFESILSSEEVIKKTECKHGTLYLTEKHLIWKTNTKEIPNVAIPSKQIQKIRKTSNPGQGFGLRVIYAEDDISKNYFFPMMNKGFPPSPKMVEMYEWENLFKKESQTTKPTEFTNIVYAGGHSAHPQKHNGKLMLTETHMIFQETSLVGEIRGNFRLTIPIKSVTHISVQSTEQISRLNTVLFGPLWSMGFPARHKFLIVEYLDDVQLQHAPIFDFPGDFGDKKKGDIMQRLHAQMRNLRQQQKKTLPELEEPMKILRTRFAKGEINKDEYLEMKKLLEQE